MGLEPVEGIIDGIRDSLRDTLDPNDPNLFRDAPLSVFVDSFERVNELRIAISSRWARVETNVIKWDQEGLNSAWDQSDSWHFDTKLFCLASDPSQRIAQCAELTQLDFGKSTAFGSGNHATTRAALTALSERLSPLPSSVLDVGCGNGVLAISSNLAGVVDVVGTDIDRAIIDEAKEYASQHKATVEFIVSNEPPTRMFDLIIANIPAAVLKDLAQKFVDNLDAKGHLLLAGFMEPDGEELDKIFKKLAMTRISQVSIDGWVALTYRFAGL